MRPFECTIYETTRLDRQDRAVEIFDAAAAYNDTPV